MRGPGAPVRRLAPARCAPPPILTAPVSRCHFCHALRMPPGPRPFPPKAHRFPDVVADKRQRIRDRHVASLNRLAEQINAGRDAHLAPWYEPDGKRTANACI